MHQNRNSLSVLSEEENLFIVWCGGGCGDMACPRWARIPLPDHSRPACPRRARRPKSSRWQKIHRVQEDRHRWQHPLWPAAV
jgi:hypothetical protein